MSDQYAMQIRMIGDHHVPFIHVCSCITPHSDLVPIVEIIIIADGRSGKSSRGGLIRNGEKVVLC